MNTKKKPISKPNSLLGIFCRISLAPSGRFVQIETLSLPQRASIHPYPMCNTDGKGRMKRRPFFSTYKEPHIVQVRVRGPDRSVEMTFATCVRIDSECERKRIF